MDVRPTSIQFSPATVQWEAKVMVPLFPINKENEDPKPAIAAEMSTLILTSLQKGEAPTVTVQKTVDGTEVITTFTKK